MSLLKVAGTTATSGQLYVDSVFSTWLYTGNGSTQTINNGIDLAGKGGLVWIKNRTTAGTNHQLIDTNSHRLASNDSNPSFTIGDTITTFNSNGFSLGADSVTGDWVNGNGSKYVSWTFRKAAKFFDVVTWTGDSSSNRQIAHSLGITPGMIIIKCTSTNRMWVVWHKSLPTPTTDYLVLNTTAASATGALWANTLPTSSDFTVSAAYDVNNTGYTYVAYLFAHDTASDGIIQCGSYTTNGSGVITSPVNLGWEPQYILYKRVDAARNWSVLDSMRGNAVANGTQNFLEPDLSDAEITSYGEPSPLATGFTVTASTASSTYIYMAIRRPNKPPTSGTQVYNAAAITATQATLPITSIGFTPDLIINGVRSTANYGQQVIDRLRGVTKQVFTEYDSAENTTNGTALVSLDMSGFTLGSDTAGTGWNAYTGYTSVKWNFKRAPGFFDVVCYTGTGSATTQAHNLTVVPEMMIVKERSAANDWWVYNATVGNTKYSVLNSTAIPVTSSTAWNNTTPTSSVFSIGTGANVNASTQTYVAYLFATLAGISKVGSYTGNGTTQTINCGFTGGARFVLIKRTDSTGDWYVFDTARGMTTLTDPYLLLNSAAAEVATLGAVTSVTTGFAVNAAIVAAINTNAASYIYLSIA